MLRRLSQEEYASTTHASMKMVTISRQFKNLLYAHRLLATVITNCWKQVTVNKDLPCGQEAILNDEVRGSSQLLMPSSTPTEA